MKSKQFQVIERHQLSTIQSCYCCGINDKEVEIWKEIFDVSWEDRQVIVKQQVKAFNIFIGSATKMNSIDCRHSITPLVFDRMGLKHEYEKKRKVVLNTSLNAQLKIIAFADKSVARNIKRIFILIFYKFTDRAIKQNWLKGRILECRL